MWQILRPPCEWCEFGQVFNGQLGHLYKLGDWKTAESWPMLKIAEQIGVFLARSTGPTEHWLKKHTFCPIRPRKNLAQSHGRLLR